MFFSFSTLHTLSEILKAEDDQLTLEGQESTRIAILDNDHIEGKISRIIVTPAKFGRSLLNMDNTVTYIPNKDICGQTEVFEYLICNHEGCDTATVSIYLPCHQPVALTGFSPTALEGAKAFTIMGLEQYPDHQLSIFNNKGNCVFQAKNYKNDWDGTYEGTPLPKDRYFYVLETKEGQLFKGYVNIEE